MEAVVREDSPDVLREKCPPDLTSVDEKDVSSKHTLHTLFCTLSNSDNVVCVHTRLSHRPSSQGWAPGVLPLCVCVCGGLSRFCIWAEGLCVVVW